MRTQLRLSRGGSALVGISLVIVALTALAPIASSADAGATKCGDRMIPQGEGYPKASVEFVETEGGISCPSAVKLIGLFMRAKEPRGWKTIEPRFPHPHKYVDQEFQKGDKYVRYAFLRRG